MAIMASDRHRVVRAMDRERNGYLRGIEHTVGSLRYFAEREEDAAAADVLNRAATAIARVHGV